ncbi:MAG: hypothetical protein IOC82_09805 [Aestuariivirga sp.]|uniref:hypothetical protein n=1 Tax=Aestuariivirga sp. TaxID=2650926 RepID=UPI0025C3B02C|nr:hypothetical protein [Aestuariivirga sp.]MCA3561305.1 hypothetical protein [Aestuariivirga sp.]
MKVWVAGFIFATVLVVLGSVALPRGIAAVRFLAGPRDEVSAAAYFLTRKTADDYTAAAERALAEKDEDLASSIAQLAAERGVTLPATLAGRIAAAQDEASARIGADAWNGFLSGDAPNEAALAGAVAADLTGIGDIRDLYNQAARYVSGEEIDPLVIGLATVGLGLTAATVATLGAAGPEKAGVSTLKAVTRAGRLSPLLARDVGMVAANALDGEALRLVGMSVARLDLAAARTASGRVLKAEAVTALKGLGSDVATIGSNAGYRTTVAALGTAKSAEEMGTLAKLSARFGTATRAVMVLGGAALTFASMMTTAAVWSLWLLLWIAGVMFGAAKLGRRIGRWIWPRPYASLRRA